MPDEGGYFRRRTRGYGYHRILQNAVVAVAKVIRRFLMARFG